MNNDAGSADGDNRPVPMERIIRLLQQVDGGGSDDNSASGGKFMSPWTLEKFVKTDIAGGNGTHDTAMAVIRKISGLADNGSDAIAEMIILTHNTYAGSAGGNGSG